MKKLILILPFLIISCSNHEVKPMEITSLDTGLYISEENKIVLDKMENMLKLTDGLENEIGETYKTKETLIRENKSLKKELISLKDSLVEVKSKLPKKQTFFQKVFSITPDSIEVTTIDTIKQ